jgi:integrase
MHAVNSMDLYDRYGHRKYLTTPEIYAFLRAADAAPPEVNTFCRTLVYSGARISEVLALSADRVDIADGLLIFESLKKRRRGIYRAVPVPPVFLQMLAEIHGLAAVRRAPDGGRGARLWSWSRATAWRRVCEVMDAASITGMHATPKGLRHGFGIRAVTKGIPLNLTQRWLGHADIATTAIYANAVGAEERLLAQRMWE